MTRTVRGTEKEAARELARLVLETEAGRHQVSPGTIGDLLDRWLEMAELEGTTRDDYESVVRKYLRPAFGEVPAHKLKAADLDRLYARLRGKVGAARINRIHTVIRAALAQAVRWEWVATNVALSASPPGQPRPDPKPPAPELVKSVLEQLQKKEPLLYCFIQLAAHTGARRGELCGLRWSNVDLDRASLLIASAVSAPKGGRQVKSTKTDRVRRIALSPATCRVLLEHQVRCKEAALAWGAGWDNNGFLFHVDGDPSTPLRPGSISQRFARWKRRAKVSGIRIKELRHLVATQLLAEGVEARQVSGRLGHARTSTTTDIYAAWLPDRDTEAAEVMARVLGS